MRRRVVESMRKSPTTVTGNSCARTTLPSSICRVGLKEETASEALSW
jgi:hypothetical protein